MSIATIDSLTYHTLLTEATNRYIAKGVPSLLAVQQALAFMESAFIIDNVAATLDGEADQKESGIYG